MLMEVYLYLFSGLKVDQDNLTLLNGYDIARNLFQQL